MTTEVVRVEAPANIDDVDEAGYLAADPDFGQGCVRTREHFKAIGQAQGRQQAIHVGRLYDSQLAKLIFATALSGERRPSGVRNFPRVATKKDQSGLGGRLEVAQQLPIHPASRPADGTRRDSPTGALRIAELARQNVMLQAQHEALWLSNSWRLTAPPRAGARCLAAEPK